MQSDTTGNIYGMRKNASRALLATQKKPSARQRHTKDYGPAGGIQRRARCRSSSLTLFCPPLRPPSMPS